jgi:hypothetical protein
MMSGRTNKHKQKGSKRERLLQSAIDTTRVVHDPYKDAKLAPHVINAAIDSPECDAGGLERGLRIMAVVNEALGLDRTVVACALCARKLGVKRCAACPRNNALRYCSRECQIAHWPQHRAVCGLDPMQVAVAVD